MSILKLFHNNIKGGLMIASNLQSLVKKFEKVMISFIKKLRNQLKYIIFI
jgi:hypothetical protein